MRENLDGVVNKSQKIDFIFEQLLMYLKVQDNKVK